MKSARDFSLWTCLKSYVFVARDNLKVFKEFIAFLKQINNLDWSKSINGDFQ